MARVAHERALARVAAERESERQKAKREVAAETTRAAVRADEKRTEEKLREIERAKANAGVPSAQELADLRRQFGIGPPSRKDRRR